MNRRIALIFALLAVIITAGCVSKTVGDVHVGYPGAIITDFGSITPSVTAGTPISLFLTMQNFGYADATDANVIIFNCGSVNKGRSSNTKDGNYKCNEGLFENNFDLQKPDQNLGIAGDSKEVDVTVFTDASSFPQGSTLQTFTARLTYDYSTTAARDVFFTTFQNWKEKGGAVAVPPLNSFSTPAPLSLSINAPQPPIVIPIGTQEAEFTVGLSIRNTGGGIVEAGKRLNKISLCYDPTFVKPVKDGTTYGDFDTDDGKCLTISGGNENLRLIGLTNQYKDVDARFRTKQDVIAVQDVATFDAEITYTYSLDRSTTVTILND